ncbi:MAG: cell division protein FtsA [Ardenticatenaceae bacterium]|nr:cell division protein FtsA [Ardenticatenaceae bacterium]
MEEILLGLDVGTTKICALVGEVKEGQLRIIGMGIQPSRGMRKGMVIDVSEASIAIARAIESAERTSGYDLSQALVSMAGEHIGCVNNKGVVAIGRDGTGVTVQDIEHALDVAQAIPLPHNRQIVHMIPRNYMVDDQRDVRNPIGMHGFRLEVEAHLITAAEPALKNLSQCVDNVGVRAEELVLNALASAEAVLEPAEREMGVIVADIGGGTTDIALYMEGHVWHTKVIPVGGYHITNDIAIGMRAPYEIADRVKIRYGDCRPEEIDPGFTFTVDAFNETIQVGRQELAHVIEARVDEIFQLILQEIRASGYDGLLPAGIVLTGGTAQLRGIADIAQRVLNVPARVAGAKNVEGMVDPLQSPAYATSVGLLRWAMNGHNVYRPRQRMPSLWGQRMKGVFKALLP